MMRTMGVSFDDQIQPIVEIYVEEEMLPLNIDIGGLEWKMK